MKNHVQTHLVWYAVGGFIFGTVGLYMLAILSLMSQSFELISVPFMAPGRLAASLAGGGDGSDMLVVALTVFNGVFYALLSSVFGIFFCGAIDAKRK